ncbi:dihydroneopterin triphosphate diphosphatase [Acidihalobacter ferrooxydans]|uniref:Dihydroneopterin triphosphate diphosphatase n=1 Tax=Acidihalobacter ferrooxydans TaxID=1765967 RepID=A0A1P8UHU4_9GAMM|nr:dihydroneopterin triphosphate diphosphatase [Acidihalobacter ferrooxydans]APZ43389.1 dihydroneopterin triphosphate diphosphatase [Acidihalobacter ferrooxydans]
MVATWKRPESVLVVIATLAGEVLLLERREPRGFWQSVTGSLEWGETAPAAAARELQEETGLVAVPEDCAATQRFPIVPPWRTRYAPEHTHNVEHVFRLILPVRVDIHINPAEHADAAWLPRAVAVSRVSSWTNREAIERWAPEANDA